MDSETALTTPTTAFVTDWTRLACRLSPDIQSIRRPARLTVITFRFMPDYDDPKHAKMLAFSNEGIPQGFDVLFRGTTVPDFCLLEGVRDLVLLVGGVLHGVVNFDVVAIEFRCRSAEFLEFEITYY